MKISVAKNTIQGSIWGIASKSVSILLPFVIRTLIIHELGVEYAGLGSLFSSILQVLSLADLGIGVAMVYAMYKPVAEDDIESISALLAFYRKVYIVIGGVVGALGLLILPFLEIFIQGAIPDNINIYILFLIYLANTVLSYSFLSYYSSILSAYQREADNSRIQLVINVLAYILQIVLLILSKNYYIYILVLPISVLCINITRYFYVRKHYPRIECRGTISRKTKNEIKKNVSALVMFKIGNAIVNSVDTIIVSAFMGLVITAYYNNYYYIISALTTLIVVVFSSITAGIGNKLITNSIDQIQKDFFRILYTNGGIVTVCTTCLYAMYQDFITLWVGKECLFSFVTMALFCAYFFLHTIRRTVLMYRDAAGIWYDNRFQPIISAVLNLGINIVLINLIGINGVIISTLVTMLFIDFPWESILLMKKVIKLPSYNYFIKVLTYFGITCISCCLYSLIRNYINISNLVISLIVDGLLSLFISSIVFVILTSTTEEFFWLWGLLKNYLSKYRRN